MTLLNDLCVVDSLDEVLLPANWQPAPTRDQELLRIVPSDAKAELRDRLLAWEAKYRAAKSEATLKAVRADWQVFVQWCARAQIHALPLASCDLVTFLSDQIVLGKKRSTLNRYLNTIRVIHSAAGLDDPSAYPDWKLEWQALVKRLRLANANAPRQAAPLYSRGVKQIQAHLAEAGGLLALRDAALIGLASDTLCRESELAALRYEDVERTSNGWLVHVRTSKTDQEGIGHVRYCSPNTKRRLDDWCAAVNIQQGPLFLSIGRRTKVDAQTERLRPLRAAEVANIVRKRAIGADVADGKRMTGHSARVGSTIEMIENGASLLETQYAGGWNDQRTVQGYGKKALAGVGAMAKLRGKQEQDSELPDEGMG